MEKKVFLKENQKGRTLCNLLNMPSFKVESTALFNLGSAVKTTRRSRANF